MSARIRPIKTSETNNKNTKFFSKTSTNFMKSPEKSPKINREFCITKSTRFSNNNITDTIASSIRTISKFKSRKKEKPKFLNLDDFHKQFILNKIKDNNLFTSFPTNKKNIKIYNTIKPNYMQNSKTPKHNLIKLNKKSASPSFIFPSNAMKSRNVVLFNYNKTTDEYNSNSLFSTFFENKNKQLSNDFSKIINNTKINNHTNSYNKYDNNENNKNNIFNNIILSPNRLKEYESIKQNNTNNSYLFNRIEYNNTSYYNQNKINEKESNNKIKKRYYHISRNAATLNEQLAYPSFCSNLFARENRNENIEQFIYKTRLMTLDRYLYNVNKDTYIKKL